MPRQSPASAALLTAVVGLFRKMPAGARWAVAGAVAVGVAALFLITRAGGPAVSAQGSNPDKGEVLFCWWNVENLFDDKDDKRGTIDEEFDNPFAQNETLRDLKYDRVASALLKMNGGVGPDIIALCEVESVRSGDILKGVLNKKLKDAKADDKLQYVNLMMKNVAAGRHIAPCVITRLPVTPQLTRLVGGGSLRILESHVSVNGHDLCILASHWTSQLKQKDGGDGDSGREKYAIKLYEAFREMNKKNNDVDVLVCGDFNDSPDADPIVKLLGALADKSKVKPSADDPPFLNLMAGKDPAKFGTLFYNGKPLIYDHICASPGLLDGNGWSVEPDSVSVPTEGLTRVGATKRQPWRFDNPGREMKDSERGFSDHFPVLVRLKVGPKANDP